MKTLLFIFLILLTSCTITQNVATRQRQLHAEHVMKHAKLPVKNNQRKNRTALAISVTIVGLWICAIGFFGSDDPFNPNNPDRKP
jgi:hypothetical protein